MGVAQFGDIVFGVVAQNLDRVVAVAIAVFGRFLVFQLVGVVGDVGFGDQRLAVFDRNTIIVRVDFVEGQKAVTVAAEIDEGRLQRRFDPCHFGEVDITFELAFGGGFVIEFE